MITVLLSAFNWLMASWLFFAFASIFIIWAFSGIRKENEFKFFPAFLLALVVAGCYYKWPGIRHFFHWPMILWTAGSYILIGGLTTIVKWFSILRRFREESGAVFAANKTSVEERRFFSVENELHLPTSSIDVVNGRAMLNWRKFSFGAWWSYWPYFSLSLILEPMLMGVDYLLELCRGIYVKMAQSFSVALPIPVKVETQARSTDIRDGR